MNHTTRRRAGMSLAVAVALAALGVLHAQQVGRAPLDVRILQPPAAVTALGRVHLVYELHVTNFGALPVRLAGLEVQDAAGARIDGWDEAQLARRVTIAGRPPSPAPASSLEPGARAVVHQWVSLAPGRQAPTWIKHHIDVVTGSDAVVTTIALPSIAVTADVMVLGLPVRGGPWVAVRGPSNASPHRLAIVAASGRATIPQRFAVDWMRLGANGLPFDGSTDDVTHWSGYGEPVYAVADGEVMLVRDGAPDRVPMTVTAPAVIEAADAPGNIVVLDLGDGRYASYAHLKPGSLRVTQGERVRAGEPVASVGNSGNTLAPHLHFQIADAIEPLAGEGLPFAMRSMELIGRVAALPALLGGAPWRADASQPARVVTGEVPLENMVVRFGG